MLNDARLAHAALGTLSGFELIFKASTFTIVLDGRKREIDTNFWDKSGTRRPYSDEMLYSGTRLIRHLNRPAEKCRITCVVVTTDVGLTVFHCISISFLLFFYNKVFQRQICIPPLTERGPS